MEWLPATAVFCLYTYEKLINFVFSTIDDDHDYFISKRDIMRFLLQEKNGKLIFPFNYVQAI